MDKDLTQIHATVTRGCVTARFCAPHVQEPGQVQKIAQEIMYLAQECRPKRFILTFAGVSHLTSAFLAKLVTLNRDLRKNGVELRLCDMNEETARAFRLCKLHRIIKLFATEEEAAQPAP